MAPLRAEWEAAQRDIGNLLVEDDQDAARVRLGSVPATPLRNRGPRSRLAAAATSCTWPWRSLLDLEKRVIDFAAANGWDDPDDQGQTRPDVGPGDQSLRCRAGPHRPLDRLHPVAPEQRLPLQPSPDSHPLSLHPQDRRHSGRRRHGHHPREPEWPAAEFIIGNPPFLGGKLLRSQLGDGYIDALFGLYDGRVPAEADLVCYCVREGAGGCWPVRLRNG